MKRSLSLVAVIISIALFSSYAMAAPKIEDEVLLKMDIIDITLGKYDYYSTLDALFPQQVLDRNHKIIEQMESGELKDYVRPLGSEHAKYLSKVGHFTVPFQYYSYIYECRKLNIPNQYLINLLTKSQGDVTESKIKLLSWAYANTEAISILTGGTR